MKQRWIVLGMFFFWSMAVVLASHSAHAQDIKARFRDRLPEINQLKADGIVGENNQGYLAFVGGRREKADVVAAENADRKTVYESIAASQGTTADLVGRRRAIQIAKIAAPGEWLQDEAGKWYRK